MAHFSSLLAANARRRALWEGDGGGAWRSRTLLAWLARLPPGALLVGVAVPKEIAAHLPADYGAQAGLGTWLCWQGYGSTRVRVLGTANATP